MSDSSAPPEYVLWPYTPSIAGGIVAAIVFAILSCGHIFRLFKNRTWFCIPFVIGALVSPNHVALLFLTNSFVSLKQSVTVLAQQLTTILYQRCPTSSSQS
jgi:hypothetical protein